MKIGIISDTHNHVQNLQKAIQCLNKHQVALVIHCGDWTLPEMMTSLKNLRAPLKGVLGNCDTDREAYLREIFRQDPDTAVRIELFDQKLELEVDGKKIAATHGNDETLLRQLIDSAQYDLVCYGHFHKPLIQQEGQTLTVNPGSVAGYYGRDIRVETLPVFAVYDTREGIAEIVKMK